jgi:peptidyl-prolyl cis-trans isomerase SurA
MLSMRKYLFSAGFALLVATTSASITMTTPPAFASQIKYVVNNVPITTGDIQHRAPAAQERRRRK